MDLIARSIHMPIYFIIKLFVKSNIKRYNLTNIQSNEMIYTAVDISHCPKNG